MFTGLITALVTPFCGGIVDERAFHALVDWQITQGVQGLVPCGTTGEAPTLSAVERDWLIRACVETASGRVPVIAGTGTNSTETTIEMTRAAQKAGATAALIVTPYYNRPNQEGLYRHFTAVADAVNLPLILYNVPSRTGVDLLPETVGRLAKYPMIVGIKDATGNLRRPHEIRAVTRSDFILLSGDDRTALAFNEAGGRGCISVIANVAPRLCVALQDACRRGDTEAARALHADLLPLVDALALETNPGPIKYALSLVRRGFEPSLRLPLVPVELATAAAIRRGVDMVLGTHPSRAAA